MGIVRLSLSVLSVMLAVLLLMAPLAEAQRQPIPQPFPRPGEPSPPPAPERPGPPPAAPPLTTSPLTPTPQWLAEAAPTEALLGVPVYPSAQFITSYDAGRGQRYYLFGTNATFEEMVSYYATIFKRRGERVFDAPATHIFEVGRFREEAMAFPPGVTIKDYSWNGSEGFLNPKRGAQPPRFRTVIQIVPVAPETR